MKKYIVIEGNIGVGKTTLATRLAQDWNMPLLLEKFLDNPFLPFFYKDPERYAFSTETAFLAERYRQMNAEMDLVDWRQEGLVADYSFYKSLIFATQTLQPQEAALFKDLFAIVNKQLPQPQLWVYLSSPTHRLLGNIRQRGRAFEQEITAEYLARVEKAYATFLEQAGGLRCLWVQWDEGADLMQDPELYERFKQRLLGDFRYGMNYLNLSEL
ncbi:MAG: deoxynucleoside kinase [Sphingomonadales bacterium]|nr:deoxynucleoside kinase [Sphingomonadales bacterium]